jgi:glycosyltransferase involved in cell wall biosynthesis
MSSLAKSVAKPDSKIKVVHVVESCFGGISTFVSMLIHSQREDPAIGEIHVLVNKKDAEQWFLELPVIFHEYDASRSIRDVIPTVRDIGGLLRNIKPDVVVLHNTYAGLWGRLITNKTWRTIYCAHGWSFAQNIKPHQRLLYGVAECLLSFRCEAIVSISRYEYNLARRFGVVGARHYLIRHGVPPVERMTEPSLPLNPSAINLAFVGRFEQQKGIDILREIFEDQELAGIHLWLVGGAVRGTPDIAFPPRANITRLGWLSRAQTDAVLQQVDALIVPSRWEGFGLVAIESMRSNRGVLASRVGGLTDIVEDGVNGRFMDIANIPACRALLKTLTKHDLAQMGDAAFATYQEYFQWRNCYASWQTAILNVLEQPSK